MSDYFVTCIKCKTVVNVNDTYVKPVDSTEGYEYTCRKCYDVPQPTGDIAKDCSRCWCAGCINRKKEIEGDSADSGDSAIHIVPECYSKNLEETTDADVEQPTGDIAKALYCLYRGSKTAYSLHSLEVNLSREEAKELRSIITKQYNLIKTELTRLQSENEGMKHTISALYQVQKELVLDKEKYKSQLDEIKELANMGYYSTKIRYATSFFEDILAILNKGSEKNG